jgi:2-phosphosulfolactate phosphatase
MRVSVLLHPDAGEVGSGVAAVVIDVLRATSTLTIALLNGARGVTAAATPEEARELRGRNPGALLCGERDGLIIPGFDLGNSPFEYAANTVAGRPLIFASTNGSQAMRRARPARRTVLAAFINAAAAVERLGAEERVVVVCAGKTGRFALEDAACAGLLCARLVGRGARLEGAPAGFALSLAPRDAGDVRRVVEGASHGRYLRQLGGEYARDVEFCGRLDAIDRAFEI